MELMLLKKLYEKGGPGSGNFGHAGRPGQVGGSASTGTGGALTGTQREDRRSTAEREQGSSKKSSVREFSRNTGKQLGIKVKVNSKAKAAGIAVHLNAIESQIESAKSVYPELDNVLINGSYPTDLAINVEQIGGNPKFRDDKGRIAPMSVDACYTHSRGEITLAPFVIGTRDFERTTMTAANSTFCRDTVDNGVASVFMHELGHKVGHCMSKKSQQMFMNFLSREKSNVGSHVSRYAADSASEAFAECFAMTVHPGFKNLMKQSKWHRDMYDVMQKVIGASVKKKSVPSMLQLFKGGPGSGNFGHASRPGQVGGSGSGTGGGGASSDSDSFGSGSQFHERKPSTTRVDRKGRVLTRLDSLDKDKLPPHLKKLRIRPDLTDVYVNLDPKGDLLATGRDSKGRPQPVYSDKFKKHQQKEKHTRVIKLEKKFDEAERDYKADQKSKDYHKKERADCLALIIDTGIRPGSERDTKADKKAYGATTLEGRHVVQRGGQTLLVFEAKCGVHQELPVTDPKVASMVVKRAQKAGPNGKLFDCNDGQLRSYTKKLDGGGFKPKDMRTLKANTTAIKVIKKEYGSSKPKTKKEFKKRVKFVGTEVSKVLGNTCSVALQSYIRPEIFTVWGTW